AGVACSQVVPRALRAPRRGNLRSRRPRSTIGAVVVPSAPLIDATSVSDESHSILDTHRWSRHDEAASQQRLDWCFDSRSTRLEGPIMKAVRFHEYGGPEVLIYEDIDKPEPGEGEVRVRIAATRSHPCHQH